MRGGRGGGGVRHEAHVPRFDQILTFIVFFNPCPAPFLKFTYIRYNNMIHVSPLQIN